MVKDVIQMKHNVRKIICATLSALTLSTCTVSASALNTCYSADNDAVEFVMGDNDERAALNNNVFWFFKTIQNADVYSTPNGKITGMINKGLTVRVYEKRGGWARITQSKNGNASWVKLTSLTKSYVQGTVMALKGVVVRRYPSLGAKIIDKIGVHTNVKIYRVYVSGPYTWVALNEDETKWACAIVNGRKDIIFNIPVLK